MARENFSGVLTVWRSCQHERKTTQSLVHALLAGAGIGDLPPIVQPELLRDGRLVEVKVYLTEN